jgi:hypothetical protein
MKLCRARWQIPGRISALSAPKTDLSHDVPHVWDAVVNRRARMSVSAEAALNLSHGFPDVRTAVPHMRRGVADVGKGAPYVRKAVPHIRKDFRDMRNTSAR